MTDQRAEAYAEAIVEIARSEDAVDAVDDELLRLARAVSENRDLHELLTNKQHPVGRRLEALDELLDLRAADNVGSGRPADAGHTEELGRRAARELEADVPLRLSQLAVDGTDLTAEVGLAPGPIIGQLLERLLESVVADPARNSREILLADARAWARDMADTPAEAQEE